jgi:hypothetical protein
MYVMIFKKYIFRLKNLAILTQIAAFGDNSLS